MREKILITGADGLLGSHVVRRALKHGYDVKAFIQPGRNTGTLCGLPVEMVFGDITHEEDIRNALSNCDYLIHTAASTALWPSRSSKIWTINYDAVVLLANEVAKSKIKRYVHVGSASSFGFGTKNNPGNETRPYLAARFKLDYQDSKKAAQDYLINQFQNTGLPVIILAPTFLIGEYDSAPSSGKMILAVIKHSIPGYSSGGKCFVYAGDVAEAAINALNKGQVGESYITGGENLSYKEYFDLISEISNTTPIKWKIPAFLTVSMGSVMEFVSRFTHKEPMITTGMAQIANEGYYYSSQKAISELEMPQTTIRESLTLSIDYFKSIGYL